MPKLYTFPSLLDEVKQVSISRLKKFGIFEEGSVKSSVLTWSRRGQVIGSINIWVYLTDPEHIILSYTYNKEEEISYKVKLVSVPSNLGKGKVWYFLCPITGERCKKLYGVGKYFLHRKAYPKAMYECQTYSKKGRGYDKAFKVMYGSDAIYSEIYSKHFKKEYAGKPTKRYQRLLKKLELINDNYRQAKGLLESEFSY